MLGVSLQALVGASATNFFTAWNPSDKNASITLSNSNLTMTTTAVAYEAVRAIKGLSSGKWYWEVTWGSTSGQASTGIALAGASLSVYIGNDASGWGMFNTDGKVYNNNVALINISGTYTSGDRIGVAFDATGGKLYFRKNGGAWLNSADPVAGTNAPVTGLTSGPYYPAVSNGTSGISACTTNFGTTAFTDAIPTGYSGVIQ